MNKSLINGLFVIPAVIIATVTCFVATEARAQSLNFDAMGDNPPVPDLQARPPRVRAALVDSGINYLLPEIADGLARDSAGKLIAYDFWDMDDRPFDSHPLANGRIVRHGTRTASLFLREAPNAALVAYRYPRPDMARMRLLIRHAIDHDVRIIGLPLGSNKSDLWTVFEDVARENPELLFIASAGNNGRDIDQEPVYPAALDLDNLLVVTSADDFVRPAEGVNWGRKSVDYLVPAEDRQILEFDGSPGKASGSSYAVPRALALAARLIEIHPEFTADDILTWIRRRFADGTAPREIGSGYLSDPEIGIDGSPVVDSKRTYAPTIVPVDSDESVETSADFTNSLSVPVELIVLNSAFDDKRIMAMLDQAATIFRQCAIAIPTVDILYGQVAAHQQYLSTGPAKTVMQSLRSSGPNKKLTIVLAHDTRMQLAFDAEAFGRANTRNRPWFTDSVWLTAALEDDGIALAHEMYHVLANSGDHVPDDGNLMLARTTGDNVLLTDAQCAAARSTAQHHGLVQ